MVCMFEILTNEENYELIIGEYYHRTWDRLKLQCADKKFIDFEEYLKMIKKNYEYSMCYLLQTEEMNNILLEKQSEVLLKERIERKLAVIRYEKLLLDFLIKAINNAITVKFIDCKY